MSTGERVEQGPGTTLWRTGSGVWLEVSDDLAGVLPAGVDVAVVATGWARGRWRFTFAGDPLPYEAPMGVHGDPALAAAMTVLAAAKQARVRGEDGARATFGELASSTPAAGLSAAEVSAVLDIRAPQAADCEALCAVVTEQARNRVARDRTTVVVDEESRTDRTPLDAAATATLQTMLGGAVVDSPGNDRAVARARAGERAAAVVLRRRDDDRVREALAALA